jgi:hypothetical protein
MNQNPYSAPEATVDVNIEAEKQQFYVVSINKFAVLFFATLGLYTIYWFYRNWSEHKKYTGSSVWPVPRGLFNIFFTHSLFAEVQSVLLQKGIAFKWSHRAQATAYVVIAIASNILDRMSLREIGSPYTDVLSLLIVPVMYATLVTAQRAINTSQGDPDGTSNSTYTAANYVWIAIGLVLWGLSLLGIAMMYGVLNLE